MRRFPEHWLRYQVARMKNGHFAAALFCDYPDVYGQEIVCTLQFNKIGYTTTHAAVQACIEKVVEIWGNKPLDVTP